MSPIRRRTFFGDKSDKNLRIEISERGGSSTLMDRFETRIAGGEDINIPVDLYVQLAADIEIRMAAAAVLQRRLESQQNARERGR